MDHHHHESPIDRSTLQYWIDGGGAWMPRWECTSGDVLLFGAMLLVVTWLAYVYWQVAQAAKSAYLEGDSSDEEREYGLRLMNVFLWCGLTHWLGQVGTYFVPVYWPIVLMYVWTAVETTRLIASKTQLHYFHERHRRSEYAKETVKAASSEMSDRELAQLVRESTARYLERSQS